MARTQFNADRCARGAWVWVLLEVICHEFPGNVSTACLRVVPGPWRSASLGLTRKSTDRGAAYLTGKKKFKKGIFILDVPVEHFSQDYEVSVVFLDVKFFICLLLHRVHFKKTVSTREICVAAFPAFFRCFEAVLCLNPTPTSPLLAALPHALLLC